jgi:hypothetical protein
LQWKPVYAKNGLAKLRVFTAGDGPTVVMLPDVGCGPSALGPWAQRLVAGGLRVVLPEPRGYGESVGPLEGVTLRDLGADVARVIETVGGAPVVASHTFGNRLACWLRIADLVRGDNGYRESFHRAPKQRIGQTLCHIIPIDAAGLRQKCYSSGRKAIRRPTY